MNFFPRVFPLLGGFFKEREECFQKFGAAFQDGVIRKAGCVIKVGEGREGSTAGDVKFRALCRRKGGPQM